MYAGLTQTQYWIIRPQSKHLYIPCYSRNIQMYQYCVLMFIVFEAACPLNVAWNAWLRHLVVLRKLQESTTVWVTLALAFLHAFNKKVICNNWLENYRKTIYWYQPFLCKPKAITWGQHYLWVRALAVQTLVFDTSNSCFVSPLLLFLFSQSLCQYMLLHQYSIPLINFSINIQTREHKSQINAIPSPSVYR